VSPRVLFKKIGIAFITLILTGVVTFILLRKTPGDVWISKAQLLAQQQNLTLAEAYRRLTLMYHFNPKEPLTQQFMDYFNGLIHGNLGQSMINQNLSVNQVIAQALPWTLFVAAVALSISFIIGNWIGVRMAWKRKSLLDPVMSLLSIFSHAIPPFIIALLLLVFLALGLGWFPFTGAYGDTTPGFNLQFIIDVLWHACLPILTYVLVGLGGQALSMKSTSVSVMNEDYVMAARARGLTEGRIVKQYVKRIAILPQVTGLALSFGAILGVSALVETLFNYPGLGNYLNQATTNRDYTELQGLLLFQSACLIVANLVADILYTKLDPRVQMEG